MKMEEERLLWMKYVLACENVAHEAVEALEALGEAVPGTSLKAARLLLAKAQALTALVEIVPLERLVLSLGV